LTAPATGWGRGAGDISGDERAAHVTSVTNGVVLNLAALAAVVGSVVEQARGVHSGPWTLACVAGGCLYLLVFLVVRARG
jgi:hypothetical protein